MIDPNEIVRRSKCPKCKYDLEAKNADIGDVGVCISCGAILKFDDELQLVPITSKEFKALNLNDQGRLAGERQMVINHNKRVNWYSDSG